MPPDMMLASILQLVKTLVRQLPGLPDLFRRPCCPNTNDQNDETNEFSRLCMVTCPLFAYAYNICSGNNPCEIVYDYTSISCLENWQFSHYPVLHGK